MKPVLSVIVPVYKAEAYLPRCIESILAQTFTDYELLLIDDGSPDDCGRICDEYARKDMRVRVFHQDNKGASAACNLGIDSAFGRYLVFVDSDDWVLPNYLHDLYEDVCAHSGVGLIIHGLMKVDSHKKKLGELVLPDTYLPADRIYEAFGESKIAEMGYQAGKIYDKSVFDAHHIRFNENIHFRQDLLLMYSYLFFCDYIYCRHVINYVYAIHNSSQSGGHLNPFETEFRGLTTFLRMWECIKEKWNVHNETYIKFLLLFPFQRALKTNYQPYYSVNRKTRINHLRKLVDIIGNELYICTQTGYKIDGFGGLLLKYRLFACYDRFISLMFRFPIRRFLYDSIRALGKDY